MTPPKVYLWCNSGNGTDWQHWIAMAEDGQVLCQHASSSRYFGQHDVGPGMHPDAYLEKFGGATPDEHFEIVVCGEAEGPPDDVYKRNQQRRAGEAA